MQEERIVHVAEEDGQLVAVQTEQADLLQLPGNIRGMLVWCGVVWCGVVWCGVVWCCVVWCGVVWCGVVWCGVVWCGVVWCGAAWWWCVGL